MFAQLGSIQFENLKTFDEFQKTSSAVFAEFALLEGKPRLQFTGQSLDEISLSIRLHVSFCKPDEELSKLQTAKSTGEILPLIWGHGGIEGNFVIMSMSETIEHADKDGSVFSTVVALTLKEYVVKNKLEQEQQRNRDNATATGDKKPVLKKKINQNTCPKMTSNLISRILANAGVINDIFTKRGGARTIENKRAITTHLNVVSPLCAELERKGTDPTTCVHKYPAIAAHAADVKKDSQVFAAKVMSSIAINDLQFKNSIFQSKVKALQTSARPLIMQGATRQV